MGEESVNNELATETASVEEVPYTQREGVITVVLTADNHLGSIGFGQQPRKREERQQRLRQAFQQATNFALEQGADLFIQAGDLFDSTTPEERDRSFVAERLAQLKQAGVHTFALGGMHDTPADKQGLSGAEMLAPQMSYAQLGALHYFAPLQPKVEPPELEPEIFEIRGTRVGICGLGELPGQQGNPLVGLPVRSDIENVDVPILILHAPIEGVNDGAANLPEVQGQISLNSISKQTRFPYIVAGYHHLYKRMQVGESEVIIAGATQHLDFSIFEQRQHDEELLPGFVFLGLAADGVRWCNHIGVEGLTVQRLVIATADLWSGDSDLGPTERILERIEPLCNANAMLQLRLEGELTRSAYHQLDLNRIRRYGEEHCFALAIDDSLLALLPEQEALAPETGERFSPRAELIALTAEWIAASSEEQEQKALELTKEELLRAMDEMKSKR